MMRFKFVKILLLA